MTERRLADPNAADWHLPDELARRFATAPRSLDAVTAASVEQHVASCAPCQRAVAARAGDVDLDAVWAEVADRLDRHESTSFRFLRRFAWGSGAGRLVAATPALRLGAMAAVALIVAAVVVASRATDRGGVFLGVAPLVPTALVALSFAPGSDPAGEAGLSTPVYGIGLLMRRALALEVLSIALLGAGTLFVPLGGLRALGWLLPALALSAGTLAGSVRWPAPAVGVALATTWASVALFARHRAGGDIAGSALFDPSGQVVIAALAVAACWVIAANRQVLFQEAG